MQEQTEEKKMSESFDLSFDELSKIAKALENDDLSIDQAMDYAKRALPLLKTCKRLLKEIKDDIDSFGDEVSKI